MSLVLFEHLNSLVHIIPLPQKVGDFIYNPFKVAARL